ncbi:hypothetical protein FOMG_19981 [Fusarium oxysporum f. sp. melonis 26406]|uniref:Uncharacterized protein n=1 Tax=Fusarium oxysporum f. sp. melonis 26406 TaxID=1089452 RepID=W9YUI8_FUSOX|nr:hypothetical protein FOMG_19981 [Fusarium oxysporum f. sp. melonis 26406]EXK23240.1 hypothetical protein FOMG_19981 [Fusarium oxysporum f. sp. melonis 26406]
MSSGCGSRWLKSACWEISKTAFGLHSAFSSRQTLGSTKCSGLT